MSCNEVFLYERKISKKSENLNFWFCYPAIESFAMASLGYLSIFKMFDEDEDINIERIYFDTTYFKIPIKYVDLIGFSISFELDFLSFIKMLKKYNLHPLANDRKENEPIIFAGGPVLMSNPVPYENFFDFISIGEKISTKKAVELIKRAKKANKTKQEILKELSRTEGIYVPKYSKGKVEIIRDNMDDEILFTPIISDKSYFKNTCVIEIERGCPKLCKFCLASYLNQPTRYVKSEKIIETIDYVLNYTNKIALLGAYVAGHPDFEKIINYISNISREREIELSVSSLRADLADINLIKTLVKCNQKSATIALEAGSQRLRDYINKNLNEQQILNTIETAQKGGLKGLKIYSVTALPTETDEDILALIDLVKKMKEVIKKGIKEGFNNLNLTISASTFIPKANTPFEDMKRPDKKIIEKRIQLLKKSFYKLGVNFRCSSVEWDDVQAFLSVSKYDLTQFLINVADNGANLGAFKREIKKFDRTLPQKSPDFIITGANELKDNVKAKL